MRAQTLPQMKPTATSARASSTYTATPRSFRNQDDHPCRISAEASADVDSIRDATAGASLGNSFSEADDAHAYTASLLSFSAAVASSHP